MGRNVTATLAENLTGQGWKQPSWAVQGKGRKMKELVQIAPPAVRELSKFFENPENAGKALRIYFKGFS